MVESLALVKASLTHLETLETFTVLWNPRSYRLERRQRAAAPAVLGMGVSPVQFLAGGTEHFSTRLLLDSTEELGPERDLRRGIERLERWAEPEPGSGLPPRLLFMWGSFRFRGILEELCEEWVRFDPDGTPLRAWVDVILRK